MMFETTIYGEPQIVQFIPHNGRTRFPHRLTIADIQDVVADYYRSPKFLMVSDAKHSAAVRPRQVAMFLARELTGTSLPQIGSRFGYRHHTTVLHALRRVEAKIAERKQMWEDITVLRSVLTRMSA